MSPDTQHQHLTQAHMQQVRGIQPLGDPRSCVAKNKNDSKSSPQHQSYPNAYTHIEQAVGRTDRLIPKSCIT